MANKHKGTGRGHEDCCSFCGAKRSDVALMFQGVDGSNICNNCVDRGYQLLRESELVSGKGKASADGRELSLDKVGAGSICHRSG